MLWLHFPIKNVLETKLCECETNVMILESIAKSQKKNSWNNDDLTMFATERHKSGGCKWWIRFWGAKRIIFIDYLSRGKATTVDYYRNFAKQFERKMREQMLDIKKKYLVDYIIKSRSESFCTKPRNWRMKTETKSRSATGRSIKRPSTC
jgi:hypothetical protein